MAGEDPEPAFVKVQELRPGATGINVHVKVADAKTVVERPKLTVVEAVVGDDTATIVLSAKNEQAELVKPGAYLTLTNAKVDMYRGSMRLALDAAGKVEEGKAKGFEPKKDINLSLVEYELVPV